MNDPKQVRKRRKTGTRRRKTPTRNRLAEIRALAGAIKCLGELPSEGDFVMFAGPLIRGLQKRYEGLHYKYIGYLQPDKPHPARLRVGS